MAKATNTLTQTQTACPSPALGEGKRKPQRFRWTGITGFWSAGQLLLEQGKIYDINRVDAEVLSTWISSGAAAVIDDEKER